MTYKMVMPNSSERPEANGMQSPVSCSAGFVIREGRRREICQLCGKTFQDKFALRQHMAVHTGMRPFRCPVCHGSFTQKGTLVRHLKLLHHNDPDYADILTGLFKMRR